MSEFKTKDGVMLYYKDWGKGQPVVFSHGWPLSSDAWEDQMMFLANKGFRVIAHDRRGHGRSDQPGEGNDMDTYADDLAQLIESLDLENMILIGHSTGGGEIARYIGRYETDRVAGAILVSSVVPGMVQTDKNPEGVPMAVFEQMRDAVEKDRSQFYIDFSIQFYGADLKGSYVSQGVRDNFWRICMQGGLKSEYECIKAFSETDFTEDLKKFDIPTLIVHGDADQVVPYPNSALRTQEIIKQAELKTYEGAAHGLPITMKQRLNEDVLEFIQGIATTGKSAASPKKTVRKPITEELSRH